MPDVIACGLYDYFEIACMRREQVELEMLNGDTLAGIAANLKTKVGREWLMLDQSDDQLQIDLKKIDVLVFIKSGQRIKIAEG